MPISNIQNPAWDNFADTLIGRLRRHHGVASNRPADANDESGTPSELDLLFEKFENGEGAERFGRVRQAPSRYVPARQVLIAIRLAATFGSPSAVEKGLHCGALTVISDIAVEDLDTIRDVLKICFPRARWQIIAPDITDGALAKAAERRLTTVITDSFDRIEPVLVLQAGGVSLPKHVQAMAPPTLLLAPISSNVLTALLQSGHLSDQIGDPAALRAALPNDDALSDLNTVTACAALRAPSLHDAVTKLNALTARDANSTGPSLEDMTGDTPALSTARRLVDDLLLWKAGKARWDEISRSLLLYGPPGTGKTWLARAIGNSSGLSVHTASFGEWQAAGHLGDMLREMRMSFSEARRKAPCVLIIDEMDAVGSRSDSDRHASHYRLQVINCFLAEMDSIVREEGVIIVGTTNHIERMDPAVLRAGRIDIKIEVPLPDAQAILTILRHHLHEEIADNDLAHLAHLAVGHSPAELETAIRAARSDARHNRQLLSLTMIKDQLHITPDTENIDRLWRIAVHEAGHAIMSAALQMGAVERIQISKDGGQIIRQALLHQSLLADFEAEIAYSLGGRAAEHILLGEISAGAGGPETSDLALATHYALQIETTFGLGFEGPVWHARPNDAHLATPGIRDRVRQRIERAEQRAGKLLTQHREALEALARELLQKRSMRASEIEPWLRDVTPLPKQRKITASAQASRQLPNPP